MSQNPWEAVDNTLSRRRAPMGWLYRSQAGMCFVPDPAFVSMEECESEGCYAPAYEGHTCDACDQEAMQEAVAKGGGQ